MWLFIASLPPGNSEAAKSPYHKVCAVCSKAAAGTQTYSDPHVPGSEEDVYLCDYHLAHPPATNPKGQTQGDPTPVTSIVVGILIFVVLAAMLGEATPKGTARDQSKVRLIMSLVALGLSVGILVMRTG
jgi:hypothetical protein